MIKISGVGLASLLVIGLLVLSLSLSKILQVLKYMTYFLKVGTVKDVLKDSSNEAFQNNYGRPKPEANSPLIFYCMKGGRAAKAAEMAESVGFKNAKYYQGSWTEWSSKHS
ncbi:rhodanese domain-containing protein CG4456-like isoform X2 [Diabrotica virgifera virgifera]|uniref:Rhodanese domain-containing protein n=2 Tax=Diabrotica virgifera virgifera TaxID=50390 RepID=A0ABM5JTR0_DIAVI|nr:rhodanese domain-containing protein CG4456-like isoform X2 [Diabrotica virgifera virgifera]